MLKDVRKNLAPTLMSHFGHLDHVSTPELLRCDWLIGRLKKQLNRCIWRSGCSPDVSEKLLKTRDVVGICFTCVSHSSKLQRRIMSIFTRWNVLEAFVHQMFYKYLFKKGSTASFPLLCIYSRPIFREEISRCFFWAKNDYLQLNFLLSE